MKHQPKQDKVAIWKIWVFVFVFSPPFIILCEIFPAFFWLFMFSCFIIGYIRMIRGTHPWVKNKRKKSSRDNK